jgi:hypothetical protein
LLIGAEEQFIRFENRVWATARQDMITNFSKSEFLSFLLTKAPF